MDENLWALQLVFLTGAITAAIDIVKNSDWKNTKMVCLAISLALMAILVPWLYEHLPALRLTISKLATEPSSWLSAGVVIYLLIQSSRPKKISIDRVQKNMIHSNDGERLGKRITESQGRIAELFIKIDQLQKELESQEVNFVNQFSTYTKTVSELDKKYDNKLKVLDTGFVLIFEKIVKNSVGDLLVLTIISNEIQTISRRYANAPRPPAPRLAPVTLLNLEGEVNSLWESLQRSKNLSEDQKSKIANPQKYSLTDEEKELIRPELHESFCQLKSKLLACHDVYIQRLNSIKPFYIQEISNKIE